MGMSVELGGNEGSGFIFARFDIVVHIKYFAAQNKLGNPLA
jgi:hypothetical protein